MGRGGRGGTGGRWEEVRPHLHPSPPPLTVCRCMRKEAGVSDTTWFTRMQSRRWPTKRCRNATKCSAGGGVRVCRGLGGWVGRVLLHKVLCKGWVCGVGGVLAHACGRRGASGWRRRVASALWPSASRSQPPPLWRAPSCPQPARPHTHTHPRGGCCPAPPPSARPLAALGWPATAASPRAPARPGRTGRTRGARTRGAGGRRRWI